MSVSLLANTLRLITNDKMRTIATNTKVFNWFCVIVFIVLVKLNDNTIITWQDNIAKLDIHTCSPLPEMLEPKIPIKVEVEEPK